MPQHRLEDPDKLLAEDKRAFLEEKLARCITRMLAGKEHGGNPFLFSLVCAKSHKLTLGWPGQELSTAATDGTAYYWNPAFLEKLDDKLTRIVIEHEAYHNVFFHTHRDRTGNRDSYIWNLAVDYVVNTVIAIDRIGSLYSYGNSSHVDDLSSVFGGQSGLGDAIPLNQLLNEMSGKSKSSGGDKKYIFADRSLNSKSADWIYDEIMKANQNNKCKACNGNGSAVTGNSGNKCPNCGGGYGSMDAHIPSKQSREEAVYEALKAANVAKSMGRGDLPAGISEFIKELAEPTLRAADIIRMAIQKAQSNAGVNKDFKRFRRRGLSVRPHAEYVPRYFDLRPRWIAMLDTSGSHDLESMKRGIKELKLVGVNAEGLIVPCDAQPYWDKATKVTNIDDLCKVNATGRGGTVFDQFFRELRQKTTGHFDVVVIITDGECADLPMELHPGCDVLWMITNTHVDFKPSFGRLIHLKE